VLNQEHAKAVLLGQRLSMIRSVGQISMLDLILVTQIDSQEVEMEEITVQYKHLLLFNQLNLLSLLNLFNQLDQQLLLSHQIPTINQKITQEANLVSHLQICGLWFSTILVQKLLTEVTLTTIVGVHQLTMVTTILGVIHGVMMMIPQVCALTTAVEMVLAIMDSVNVKKDLKECLVIKGLMVAATGNQQE
jgi:hypothetical protein